MDIERKKIVISGGFLVIFLLLIAFVIYPLFKDIKNRSEELLSVERDLISLEEKSKQTAILKEKFPVLEPDLEKIQGLFIDPEIPINFLQFLEKTARDCSILIDISLLPQKEKEIAPFPFLSFQLSLRGSFSNSLKFLGKLEAAPYLIEIENFTTRRLTETQLRSEKYKGLSVGNVEFNLSIKVFTSGSTSSP